MSIPPYPFVTFCGAFANTLQEDVYEEALAAEQPEDICGYYLAYLDGDEKPPYLLIELSGDPEMPVYRVVAPSGLRVTINHGSIEGYDRAELLGISDGYVKIKYTDSHIPGSSNIVEYEVRGGNLAIHSQFEHGDESAKETNKL